MNEKVKKIDEFLNTDYGKGRYVSGVFKKIKSLDYDDDFIDDENKIKDVIFAFNPKGVRGISTLCSVFVNYAEFVGDKKSCTMIKRIDRKSLWEEFKEKNIVKKRYISYKEYLDAMNMLEYEDNSLYLQTLFGVIYEGVYCEDMSVITNLRASDVHGDIVELHRSDNFTYTMQLSRGLLDNLIELGDLHVYEKRNRYTVYDMDTFGRYNDSCFKIVSLKNNSEESHKFCHYSKLRKIAKMLEVKLLPKQLFISGIMYRIILKLNDNNISLEDAFSFKYENEKVTKIIRNELDRCMYDISVTAFREQVVNYLDNFE